MKRIEVNSNNTESSVTLLRRFSKRVQGSGVLKTARAAGTKLRPLSPLKKKKDALKRIDKRTRYERDKKLGKIIPNAFGRK